jgi:heme-degrading monooxygenase HmoA
MIARIWTGVTRDEEADAYEEYMREVAAPGYTSIPGHRALLMLRRGCGDGRTEFTMITCWDDMESITVFAGPDPERAVFYPRDEHFLVDRDLAVRHYEVYGSHGLAR